MGWIDLTVTITYLVLIVTLGCSAGYLNRRRGKGEAADYFLAGGTLRWPIIGMALFADGGMMATKPYASGGAYINKMSDSCKSCRFDPKQRTGPDACPYTTLYWDFLARNESALAGNHRMARQLAAMRKLSNLAEVRERAVEVLARLDEGRL